MGARAKGRNRGKTEKGSATEWTVTILQYLLFLENKHGCNLFETETSSPRLRPLPLHLRHCLGFHLLCSFVPAVRQSTRDPNLPSHSHRFHPLHSWLPGTFLHRRGRQSVYLHSDHHLRTFRFLASYLSFVSSPSPSPGRRRSRPLPQSFPPQFSFWHQARNPSLRTLPYHHFTRIFFTRILHVWELARKLFWGFNCR